LPSYTPRHWVARIPRGCHSPYPLVWAPANNGQFKRAGEQGLELGANEWEGMSFISHGSHWFARNPSPPFPASLKSLTARLGRKVTLTYSFTLKMVAGNSFETLVNMCQTTRRHIPEDEISVHVRTLREPASLK
jgi:hypothetical protein